MARIIWTESSLQDLDEIAEYIALDKINAAKKLVRRVFAAVERLSEFPKSGRKPPEFKPPDSSENEKQHSNDMYRSKQSRPLVSAGFKKNVLQNAIVWSEVLSKPVALREGDR